MATKSKYSGIGNDETLDLILWALPRKTELCLLYLMAIPLALLLTTPI